MINIVSISKLRFALNNNNISLDSPVNNFLQDFYQLFHLDCRNESFHKVDYNDRVNQIHTQGSIEPKISKFVRQN